MRCTSRRPVFKCTFKHDGIWTLVVQSNTLNQSISTMQEAMKNECVKRTMDGGKGRGEKKRENALNLYLLSDSNQSPSRV